MAFDTELVIPAKIGVYSLNQAFYGEGIKIDELRLSLDCLAEVRDEEALRMARYQ